MEYSINYAKKSHLYKTGKYGWALTIELPNRVCSSVLSSWVEIKTITAAEVKTSAQLSDKSSALLQCNFPIKYSFLYTTIRSFSHRSAFLVRWYMHHEVRNSSRSSK
jgi:hypothetical protein